MAEFFHAVIDYHDLSSFEDSCGTHVDAYFVSSAKAEAWIAVEQAKIHPVADEWGELKFLGGGGVKIVPSDEYSEWFDLATDTHYSACVRKITTVD